MPHEALKAPYATGVLLSAEIVEFNSTVESAFFATSFELHFSDLILLGECSKRITGFLRD